MYNPEPLRRFLESALGSPYVYGGTGQICAPNYRGQRARQYPAMANMIRENCPVLSGRKKTCAQCKYDGKSCYDCAQLVRKAFAILDIPFPSGASSQWKKEALWAWRGELPPQAASVFGVVFRLDEDGDAARPMRHVGVCLGKGHVIDARSHRLGVIKTKFTAYPWTHFAIPRGFQVPDFLPEPGPEIRFPGSVDTPRPPLDPPLQEQSLLIGAQGELVRLLQAQLLRLGYYLPRYGADGKYGRETAAAVVAFQKVTGLPPTGQADAPTMARLFPRPKPSAPPDDELFDM